jgi:hypothetical protein
MKVTFDSNVWQMVADPSLARNGPHLADYEKVHAAIKTRKIEGLICETVGTLEVVRRRERKDYFTAMHSNVDVKADVQSDQVLMSINVNTNHDQHPGLPDILKKRLELALSLGMKLMRAVRMGIPAPSTFLDLSLYADENDVPTAAARDNHWGEIVGEIEARGVGGGVIAKLDKSIRGSALDAQTGREFVRAVSEWADGDAVAAHIAYGNDIFCTQDQGKSAGGPSILDEENRLWLSSTYGVAFATISGLAAQL